VPHRIIAERGSMEWGSLAASSALPISPAENVHGNTQKDILWHRPFRTLNTGESVPVTEVTGFTTQPLRGSRFLKGNGIKAGGFNHRWPNRDLCPEGTPSKKSKPAGARAVIPGICFPDDSEIHLKKKIWVKGSVSCHANR
jgi:hypothetical protein